MYGEVERIGLFRILVGGVRSLAGDDKDERLSQSLGRQVSCRSYTYMQRERNASHRKFPKDTNANKRST